MTGWETQTVMIGDTTGPEETDFVIPDSARVLTVFDTKYGIAENVPQFLGFDIGFSTLDSFDLTIGSLSLSSSDYDLKTYSVEN